MLVCRLKRRGFLSAEAPDVGYSDSGLPGREQIIQGHYCGPEPRPAKTLRYIGHVLVAELRFVNRCCFM